jgi:hypothetical protein
MSIEKLREHKIFGLAIFDLSISFIGIIVIFLIAWKMHYPRLDWWKFVISAIIVTIPISITFHTLFGVNTELDYALGLSDKPKK